MYLLLCIPDSHNVDIVSLVLNGFTSVRVIVLVPVASLCMMCTRFAQYATLKYRSGLPVRSYFVRQNRMGTTALSFVLPSAPVHRA